MRAQIKSFWSRALQSPLLSTTIPWLLVLFLFLDRESLRGQLTSSQSFNEYGKKLAVVIPFIEAEIPQIEVNFKLWQDKFPPCDPAHSTHRHVDLVFYFNQDWASRPLLMSKLQSLFTSSPQVRRCFRSLRFLMANLPARSEEDRYPLGSSLMFFRAMELPTLLDHYRYMHWMEADQVPCRKGWLDRLYRTATNHPDFWILGSLIRDGQQSNTYYSFADHINGNALYRLDDPKFHEFLATVQEEFSKNKSKFLAAFDIAIYLVARHTLPFAQYAQIKHRFVYTDLVQNHYRTAANITQVCDANPDTYLVHGKYLSLPGQV